MDASNMIGIISIAHLVQKKKETPIAGKHFKGNIQSHAEKITRKVF